MGKLKLVDDVCSPELTSIYLDNILHNLPINLFWMDKDGRIMSCSSNQAKVFGLKSATELIGKNIFEVGELLGWEKSIPEEIRKNDLEIMQTKIPRTIEEDVLVNGEHRTFLTFKSPLLDKNNLVSGIFGFAFDITERKKLEEDLKKSKDIAEVANKAKTEFLDNMRHDIRTPLTGIIGFANLIRDETKDHKISEYADNMLASSNALMDFLNEVLEAIKVTSKEIPILKKKFNLKDRLQSVINLNLAKAMEKGISLILNYDDSIPAYVVGDPKRIHRIILELVVNAINFTNTGEISISAKLAKKHERENAFPINIIKLIVTDTGIGMPPDKKEEIFLKFSRLTPAYEGIYKGAGLGLTIIKQFIEDIGGEIYVESELGKGTAFTCIIPLCEALLKDEFGVDKTEEIFALPVLNMKSKLNVSTETKINTKALAQILLVEDQEIAAQVVKKMLSNMNCAVELVKDGNTAFAKAKTGSYDLIFMDIGLPDISGHEVTKLIREWESALDKHTPIVALTAHVDTEDKQKCIEIGMDAVLSKPLMKDTAFDILNAFIPKLAYSQNKIASKRRKPSNPEKSTHALLKISGKVIDLKLGAKLLNGKEDLAKNMVKLLVKSLPQEIKGLQSAYKRNDWETIKSIAHKLRGGASYCGTPRLKTACANLEDHLKVKENQPKLKDALYKQMIEEIQAIKKAYVKL